MVGSYKADKFSSKFLQKLMTYPHGRPPYQLQNGILKYKGRIVFGSSKDLRAKSVQQCHNSAIGGYSCKWATYKRLKQYFFWSGAQKQVEDWIRCSCKTEKVPVSVLLQPLAISSNHGYMFPLILLNNYQSRRQRILC